MKKTYSKPAIIFEDFSLTASITVGCDKIAQAAEYQCAYEITTSLGVVSIFTEQVIGDVCKTTKPDGYNEICYHVPTAETNVFTS